RVAAEAEHRVELRLADDALSLAGSGLLEVSDRVGVDKPLSECPTQGSLDRPAVVPLRAAGKSFQAVEPLLDVVGPEIANRERRLSLCEALQPIAIPLVGVGRPVLLAPVEKEIDQRDQRARRSGEPPGLGNEPMERLKCGFLVTAKIDAGAVDRHEPRAAVR